MKIIVSGGGTGGHIYPAIAIAQYFKKQDKNTQIVYIGGKYGIENKIIKNYDYKFETIDIKGFQRKLSLENIKRGFKAVSTMLKVRGIINREKPDLVIGTGGYVSGPIVYMASLMGVKTAILEQNVFMGMTNKILAKKVDYIFYGFEESLKRYDYKNVVVSGNPIRIDEFEADKKSSRIELGFGQDEKIVLSVGGSGGSEALNKAVIDSIYYFEMKDIRLIHVCGENYYQDIKSKIENIKYDKFEIYPYIKDIAKYMIASDLVVCSSGASTLSELTYLAKPIITIPKEYTAENHQQYNASMIQDSLAGYFIKESELNKDVFIEKIQDILFEDKKMQEFSLNSKKLNKGDSCRIIYETLLEKGK